MSTALTPRPTRGITVALVAAVVYALAGGLSLSLTIPPGYASPIYLASGIGLAASIAFGRWGVMGAALGALAIHLGLGMQQDRPIGLSIAIALSISAGVALQAAVGVGLLRRFIGRTPTLSEPRELAIFFILGGPVACLISASMATLTLTASGVVPLGLALGFWGVWWAGDTFGVLIAAPIALAFVGQPHAEWRRRRWVVSLPLLAASMLLAAATAWVMHAHENRVRTAFERDAWALGERVEAQLRAPLHALLAMHALFDTQQRIDPDEMRKAAQAWLDDQPYLLAIGYSERVPKVEVPAFERRIREEGPVADYRVFDRPDAVEVPGDADVLAIRYIEPLVSNRPALGVNQRSIPAAREAVARATDTGEAAASSGFRLTQAQGDQTGIVLYQPLFRGTPTDTASRRAALIGTVFVTLRLDAMLAVLFEDRPTYLDWCLVDQAPGAVRPRLAGHEGCEMPVPGVLRYVHTLQVAGRDLRLTVGAGRDGVPGLADGDAWAFEMVGLLSISWLGALLLIVSGRQQRIEAAVTERTADLQATSQALRESQERLRNIVDHVPIGVLYTDGAGRVREANPGLLAMLGLAALPAPPPHLLDWVHADDRAMVEALLRDLAEGGRVLARRQLRLTRPGGEPVAVRLDLSTLQGEDGRPHRLVGVVEDIGEHLQLEASERARETAEAASRAKSEFVGRMSHELRTPLNAMLGFSQLLARDASPPLADHQRRWTDQVQDAGWHLLNMINDTLDLSMIESGALRLVPAPLDPRALLTATQSLVAAAAERRKIMLAPPQIAADTPPVLGDETRVKQILTNLLSNAVKYNVEGGRVEVEVGPAADRGQVAFRVHDNGAGLNAEQLGQLFQPFNRLGREGSGVEGTGIGLVISRRLAECMGGTLEASSAPGQGSTFELRLPRASGHEAPQRETPAAVIDGHYRRRHVHYVEDNETNIVLMRGMLAQRPQIELTVSRMGLDALADVRQRRPDLLLLDMHLPDIDGLDLLHHLKSDSGTSGIPVIVLSADATPSRIERAMQAGAADYLPKPLSLPELLARVDALLEQMDTIWSE
jgi:PAS domain S-box-containing protein